jgi:hypothetical protein
LSVLSSQCLTSINTAIHRLHIEAVRASPTPSGRSPATASSSPVRRTTPTRSGKISRRSHAGRSGNTCCRSSRWVTSSAARAQPTFRSR